MTLALARITSEQRATRFFIEQTPNEKLVGITKLWIMSFEF